MAKSANTSLFLLHFQLSWFWWLLSLSHIGTGTFWHQHSLEATKIRTIDKLSFFIRILQTHSSVMLEKSVIFIAKLFTQHSHLWPNHGFVSWLHCIFIKLLRQFSSWTRPSTRVHSLYLNQTHNLFHYMGFSDSNIQKTIVGKVTHFSCTLTTPFMLCMPIDLKFLSMTSLHLQSKDTTPWSFVKTSLCPGQENPITMR